MNKRNQDCVNPLNTERLKVIVADDHELFRKGLMRLLSDTNAFEVIAEAGNGPQTLEVISEHAADILLLDLSMPEVSGMEVIQQIKQLRAQMPILVLSMHADVQIVARVLKLGANGYLTKECSPEKLVTALKKVIEHGRYIEPSLAVKLVFNQVGNAHQAAIATLTERESQILRLIIEGRSLVQIAELLVLSPKTISTHKKRIMEKLGVDSLPALIRCAAGIEWH